MRMLIKQFLVAFCISWGFVAEESLARDNNEWLEVSSPHFIVRSNAKEERVVKMVADLERFRSVIARITHLDFSEELSPPLIIYAFDKTYQYQRAMWARGTLGFYNQRLAGAVAFLSLEDRDEERMPTGFQVLLHEYTHHLLHQYSPLRYPRWYDEGFAEYVSTISIDEDVVILGALVLERAVLLKNTRWIPLSEIIEARGNYLSGSRNGVSNSLMQYAQGWLLVHYIYARHDLGRKLPDFLRATNDSSEDAGLVFARNMGITVKEMSNKLQRYWKEWGFLGLSIKVADLPPPPAIRIRKIGAAEAKVITSEAQYFADFDNWGRYKRKRLIKKALSAGVRPEDMHRYLATYAIEDQKFDLAERHIGALEALIPDHPEVLLLKARLVGAGGSKDEDKTRRLRIMLREAILQDSKYAPAYYALGNSYLGDETELSAEAFVAFDSLRRLRPYVTEVETAYVRLLIKAQRFEEAETLLVSLIAWASGPTEGKKLEKLRSMLRLAREKSAQGRKTAETVD